MKFFWCISLVLLIASCGKGIEDDDSCNGESTRRDIKLCLDSAAYEIDTIPIITTVDSIGSFDIPEANRKTPRLDIEKKVFTITGLVHKVSHHRDGDWKIKLISDKEKYINCEAPNIGCEHAVNSPFYDKFVKVREFIDPIGEDLEGQVITITGVAFHDIDHPYPRNAADNELELHPILDISF